jgi:hypothetical protein
VDATEIKERLQAPFPASDIEWRVGSTNKDKTKGLALAYVTNRAIQNRLDDVFGPFGWQNIYREWKGTSQLCGISVKYEGEWITKWDGADNSNQEATKGGLSDSMKRAAYQWGIGRYLYNLPTTWVRIKPMGKSYTLDEKPKLPAWALPPGEKQPTTNYQSSKDNVKVKYLTLGYPEEKFDKWYEDKRQSLSDLQIESNLTKMLKEKSA